MRSPGTSCASERCLLQDWDDSHSAQFLYTSFLGGGVRFSAHAASKQSIMALVGAGFGVTLVVKSRSEVPFPGVVYRPIGEDDAWVQVELAWLANVSGERRWAASLPSCATRRAHADLL